MPDLVGQQLGNYRVQRLLGEGGFAQVYLGEHLHLGTPAALKVLTVTLDSAEVERFRAEARTVARLKHPHIVRLLDFGVEGRLPFLVMEYAPHGSLRQRHPKGTQLALSSVLPYVQQAASALQYAHEHQVIHRDIKPQNLLLSEEGELLLSDFGIAIVAETTSFQSAQGIAGTAAYAAPEQLQGKARYASDQYALGIVVYEWLAGTTPFHGSYQEMISQHALTPPPPLRDQVPSLSREVEYVVLTALAKDPRQRFSSVLAFATAFEQASQVKAPEPEPEPIPAQPAWEMTGTSPSQLPTKPASLTPSLQQTVSESSIDTPVQPQTLIPASGLQPSSHIEAVRRLPTEATRTQGTPAFRAGARATARPATPGVPRRFLLLGLTGLLILTLIGGTAWFAVHQAAPTGHSAQTPVPTISPGGTITEFPVPTANSAPLGITAGPDGTLWFTELGGNKIGRITHGGSITEFPLPTAGSSPDEITAGPDGTLWFTATNTNTVGIHHDFIGRISPNGTITEFPLPTAYGEPRGITAGPDGTLWFTEWTGNQIGRMSPNGSITEFPLPTANSEPRGITAGPDGTLWFVEEGGISPQAGNKIGRITLSGSITEFPLPAGGTPEGITAGPDGNLWFTEYDGNKIGRITPSGFITEFPLPRAKSLPYAITAGPDHNLWFTVSDRSDQVPHIDFIGRISPKGIVTVFPIPTARCLPYAITAGPDGNLWFTELGGNKIGRITPGK